jgi:hypothetical protein
MVDPTIFAEACNVISYYPGMGSLSISYNPHKESWTVTITFSDYDKYTTDHEDINVALKETTDKVVKGRLKRERDNT